MIPLPSLDECMRLFLQPYVQKGAALLDEEMQGWAQKINPSTLNLSSDEMCICGQLFGSYCRRTIAISHPYRYGFDIPYESDMPLFSGDGIYWASSWDHELGDYGLDPDYDDLAWAALDLLWLDEVQWRVG